MEHECEDNVCCECERVEELVEALGDFFEDTGFSAYDVLFGISIITHDLKIEAEEESDFNLAESLAADIDAFETCLDKLEQNAEFFGNCKGSGVTN